MRVHLPRHLILHSRSTGVWVRIVRPAPELATSPSKGAQDAANVEGGVVSVIHDFHLSLCFLVIQSRSIVSMRIPQAETSHEEVVENTEAAIANYTAHLAPDTWAQMQDFVRGTISSRYAPHHGVVDVKNALPILTSFVDWTMFSGLGEPDESILTDALIDSYTAAREAEVLPYVAARERKLLRSIAGLKNTAGTDRTSTTAPVSQPYTLEEQGAIRRWAETQPTERRRVMCGAVVALTLGAGLTRDELMHVRERDIVALQDGLVGVRVGVRVVPVIHEWNDHLTRFVGRTGETYVILPDATRRSGVGMNKVLGRAPSHSWHPNVQRMRNTWIIRCLDAGVPLQNVVDAAGLRTPEMLRRLIPFMAKLDADAAVRAFRLSGEVAGR